MKTIEEELNEQIKKLTFQGDSQYYDGKVVGFEFGFLKGIEFAQKWYDPKIDPPEPHTQVLVIIDRGEGKTWELLARFIPKRTVLAEDFFEDYEEEDMDYDKKTDQYFIPESWVECSWSVEDAILLEPVIKYRYIEIK